MARISRISQLAASVGLSALFLVVYGWTNWFTAQRGIVSTLSFAWERSIPFVPLMIVPYMSIDLFFVGAPFFCRSDRELATFSKRIAAAILVAGACFLLFPFRFSFERPAVGGWLGAFFDWFRGLDQPHNLLPSLHITFCTILANHYARHTRGFWRGASNIWFVLIAFSAVLTYQHHVMDVVAGFALGVLCLYAFVGQAHRRPSDMRQAERLPYNSMEEAALRPGIKNRRVASYYLIGALACAALAILFWPWGMFFFWPALSLALVARAYLGAGPVVYRKADGVLPWTTWWTLGVVLAGHEISRLYYRRRGPPWDKLTPQVWIGGLLNHHESSATVGEGVTAVLDLTAEFSESAPFRAVTYKNIPVLDLTAPSNERLEEMVAFIDRESKSGIVYVHCKIGYSRTALVATAWLLRSRHATSVAEAIDLVRRARPAVVMRPEVLAALRRFEANEFSSRPVALSSNN